MGDTTTYTETLTVITCSSEGCGVTFALTEAFIAARRQDHATWYCPNGHHRYYPSETELEREKRRRASAEEDSRIYRAEAETERKRAAAFKGNLTKARRRWARGVCPCCRRTFPNVAAHMQTEHPEELEETK
jgi:hypothetical protein